MRIVTFGEIMLRLSSPKYQRIIQAEKLNVTYGGGEANVAISLATFGENVAYVTKLPDNALGQSAINFLRRFSVDTSHILRGGERIGIYFLEQGADLRPSNVIYDRSGSSIAKAALHEFNWAEILEGAGWFHFTGVTPALGGELIDICQEVLRICRSRKIRVSCDLNYRKKMWAADTAGSSLAKLLPYVDVCIANDEHIPLLFNIHELDRDENGNLTKNTCKRLTNYICERFGCEQVALTQRRSLKSDLNEWTGMLFDKGNCFYSPVYSINIVDRVGGGDAFAAGLIYALLHNYESQKAIEFAMTAGVLKHSIEGDANLVSVSEVEEMRHGAGEVRR